MSGRILTLFDQDFTPKQEPEEQEKETQPVTGKISDIVTENNIEEIVPILDTTIPEDSMPEGDNYVVEAGESAEIEAIYLNDKEPTVDSIQLPIGEAQNEESKASENVDGIENQPKSKKKKAKVVSEQSQGTSEEKSKIEITEDWKGEKQYYTIGEVAEMFKVNTSHIRFWTNEFNIKVRTTRKGDRLYTTAQIQELRAIHHLVKERGFKLSGAKAKLKEQNKRDVHTIDLKQSLIQLRNKLVIIRKQLS